MATKVINQKSGEPFDVYIGRPSIYGNPMRIGTKVDGKPELVNREEAVAWYREYFYARLKTDANFGRLVLALKDKVLCCHCKPLPCHGDIIVEYLEAEDE